MPYLVVGIGKIDPLRKLETLCVEFVLLQPVQQLVLLRVRDFFMAGQNPQRGAIGIGHHGSVSIAIGHGVVAVNARKKVYGKDTVMVGLVRPTYALLPVAVAVATIDDFHMIAFWNVTSRTVDTSRFKPGGIGGNLIPLPGVLVGIHRDSRHSGIDAVGSAPRMPTHEHIQHQQKHNYGSHYDARNGTT